MRRLMCLCPLILATGSFTAGAEVKPYELKNGMTVILKPLPQATHAALVVIFDIGGDHDPAGKSGLAHTVEHQYVTAATATKPARTIREYIAAYPQGWNAQTGDRYTVIATLFAPGAIDDELQDAAERMRSLRVTEADLAREKPRLRNELYNMYRGIPQLAARNLAREMIRPGPAGHRRGGVMEHIAKLSVADVQTWWQKYYKPNHATLVLAGRFDSNSAKRKIQQLFAEVEPGDLLPKVLPTENADFTAPLRKKIKPLQRSKTASRVCLAYTAPEVSSNNFPAFLVLVAKLQAQAAALPSPPGDFPVQFLPIDDPSVVCVTSEVQSDETTEQTIQRLDKFVNRVVSDKITQQDRQRAKQMFAMFYGTAEIPESALSRNPYGVAFGLGRRQQLGIQPRVLRRTIDSARTADFDHCREQIFAVKQRAAVVVIPE